MTPNQKPARAPERGSELPQQAESIPTDRMASAPYNFVPLPERVVTPVTSAAELPPHTTYGPAGYPHTGYFEVTLTTKSPLYVRCAVPLADFLRPDADDEALPFRQRVKNTPHFYYTWDPEEPVIPGPTLRGMLRAVLEIASYGKVIAVSEKRLFYRTVDDTAVGMAYGKRMMAGTGQAGDGYRTRVEAGFWCVTPEGDCGIERCVAARVEETDVATAFGLAGPADLYEGSGPRARPKWDYQHRRVWVEVESAEQDHARSEGWFLRYRQVTRIQRERPEVPATERGEPSSGAGLHPAPSSPRLLPGTLVLTGPMQKKHMAFVFLRLRNPQRVPVPNEGEEHERLVDRFHDDDQITAWQRDAFPQKQPPRGQRPRDGHLRHDEPVFFLRENGTLVFFGRAQLFRLPYRRRPIDLVPDFLRRPEDTDYAEALFGYVPRRRREVDARVPSAYAGRVSVTDARLATPAPPPDRLWLRRDPIVPRILASPKPTAFQQYLVQPDPAANKENLKHYDSDGTTIRGHKRYWPQGKRGAHELEEHGEVGANSTQHTWFKPVAAGVAFSFRVYFENLSDAELGALCWTLHPLGPPPAAGEQPAEYCHSLGMGKPLGMGVVTLNATLHLTRRTDRYTTLFAERGDSWTWATGEEAEPARRLDDRPTLERLAEPFERDVLAALGVDKQVTHLHDRERIAALLLMMRWSGFPPVTPPARDNRYLPKESRPNTRYMSIQLAGVDRRQANEYRDRPVLPSPDEFCRAEPAQKQRAPQYAGASPATGASGTRLAAVAANVEEEWPAAIVSYAPNNATLSARANGKHALAGGKEAREILDRLPEDARARLTGTGPRKKRPVSLQKVTVRVRRTGNQCQLIAVLLSTS